MFSPATLACILGFGGCEYMQVVQQQGGMSFLGEAKGLVLIYVDVLEVAFLLAALVCSVISIERLTFGSTSPGLISQSIDQPMPRHRAALPDDPSSSIGQTVQYGQDEKSASPPSEAGNRPSGTIIHLGDFRKRRSEGGGR